MKILLTIVLVISMFWVIRFVSIHEINKDGLPILGYHNVVDDDIKDKYYKWDIYVMSISQFEAQMQYLYDSGFETLSMNEIKDYYDSKRNISKKAVAITFDDGYLIFKEKVEPILTKFKFKATCFVIGKKIGQKQSKIGHEYLDQDDIVNNEVVSYYSHSYGLHHKASGFNKKAMDYATYSQIEQDFNKNKEYVSDKYFAFPFGRSSDEVQKYLASSTTYLAFGYNQNRNMQRKDNKYLLPRYLMFSKMPMFYFKWIVE